MRSCVACDTPCPAFLAACPDVAIDNRRKMATFGRADAVGDALWRDCADLPLWIGRERPVGHVEPDLGAASPEAVKRQPVGLDRRLKNGREVMRESAMVEGADRIRRTVVT